MINLSSQGFTSSQWGSAAYDSVSNTATVTQAFAYATTVSGKLGGNATVSVIFAIDGHSASWISPSLGGSTAFLLRDPSTNNYYLFSNTSLNVGDSFGFTGQSVDQFAPPCFVAGTRIATETGPRPVEALRVGDRVVTDGRSGPVLREVVWLGHRPVDLRRHPRPHAVAPVRITAGAFAPSLPARDLLLSPDHAVFVPGTRGAGVLVPAHRLVNGATIVQETTASRVVYHHVELDAHDLLHAEGLRCESYLDTGNRAAFAGGVSALHPNFAPRHWDRDACAPLLTGGVALAAIRGALHARALALGHRLRRVDALRLLDGARELACRDIAAGRHVFALPPGLAALRLRSASFVAAEADPDSDDPRRLGLLISGLRLLRGDRAVPVSLRGRVPQTGFYPIEPGARWRWTDGDALLALPAASGFTGIEIAVASCMRGWDAKPERVLGVA